MLNEILFTLQVLSMLFSMLDASILPLKSCQSNDDCLGNEYCYLATRYCSSCLDCSQYGQYNPPGCAKEHRECAKCLPGYVEDIKNEYHDGRKRCIAIVADQTTTEKDNNYLEAKHLDVVATVLYSLLGIIVIIMLVLFLWWLLRKLKHQNQCSISEKSRELNLPTAPMMNHESILNNQCEGLACPPPAYTDEPLMPDRRVTDRVQETRPWATPNYVLPPQATEDHPDSAASDINISAGGDDTEPSPWTPSPSNGDRTSFAGALEANRTVRRHSNAEDIQEQDEPPPKQSKTSDNLRGFQVNINNIINISSSIVQEQSQNNLNTANALNMNCFSQNDSGNTSNSEDDDENCRSRPNSRGTDREQLQRFEDRNPRRFQNN